MGEILRLTPAQILQDNIETEAASRAGDDRLRQGTQAPGGAAVAGLNGEYFISQGSNQWENQYTGRVAVTETWLEAWTRLFTIRQAQAVRHGVQLWNIVIPEKQVISPEARWVSPVSGDERPFAKLLPRLTPAQRVFYAAGSLSKAKARGAAYFVRNSHWTPFGCLTAVHDLLAAMGIDAQIAEMRFAYERLETAHDLPPHFFETPRKVGAGLLAANGACVFEERPAGSGGRYAGSRYGIHNPEAPVSRRLVIFGDSFSYDAGLAAALSAVFETVVFVWGKDVDWAQVAEHRADIVLWEGAERFLATLPRA